MYMYRYMCSALQCVAVRCSIYIHIYINVYM